MFLMRRPKDRPSTALACPDCGQALEWQRCAGCDGYGAWDVGVGAFDCVFCGGTGWQPAPHACPAQPGARGAETPVASGTLPEGPGILASDATPTGPDARPAPIGVARKTALVLLVAFILLLILATTLAALFLNLR